MAPKSSEQFEQIRTDSKAKILVAALELFAIDGYHNTSISKIAKHADISKGLMYNYFESKEDLLKSVVLMSLSEADELSETMEEGMANLSPKEVLKTMIEMFFTMLVKNKTMWKLTLSLAMQVSNMPSIEEAITKMFNDIFSKVELVLQMNGYEDYKVESKLLAAQLDGISLHYIIFEHTYDLEAVKKSLLKKYSLD